MTMITPSYLGETIEYSSLHACRSTLEDPTNSQPDYLPSDPFPADPRCQQLSLQRRRNVVCPSQLLLARRSASLLF